MSTPTPMRVPPLVTRTGLALVIVAVMAATACSTADDREDRATTGTTQPTPAATNTAPDGDTAPGPSDPDDVDYSEDAGQTLKEFEYPDDPPPADSVVATLCNLNQEYFRVLRPTESDIPVVDDGLRRNLLALSDLLGSWESLRTHQPDMVPAIDTAQLIHDTWDQALLSHDNGDETVAQEKMLEAEELIGQLPTEEAAVCDR